jgi:hypothetical protein
MYASIRVMGNTAVGSGEVSEAWVVGRFANRPYKYTAASGAVRQDSNRQMVCARQVVGPIWRVLWGAGWCGGWRNRGGFSFIKHM